MAGEIVILTDVNTPRWLSLRPAEPHSSCLSLMSFHARGQIYDSSGDSQSQKCTSNGVHKHTQSFVSSSSARRQHRENNLLGCNLEKREHEQWFFLFLLSFPGAAKGFRTSILIFTHNLRLSGEAR